jgi:carbon storage regulator CsrA
MLVLTRKKSETVQIGDNIVIKVIQTGRGAIKLGIEAPADVRVLRGEVAEEAARLLSAGPAKPSTQADRPFRPRTGVTEPVCGGAV